jgi:hypothetical protein
MATHDLHDEFLEAQRRVSLGDRALVAIAAHVEVRAVLRASGELLAHGLDDVLIGSYARRVSIWPGKDVDVFGRLMSETTDTIGPDAAYHIFERALARFASEGRLTLQPRSLKIDYSQRRTPSPEYIRAAAHEYSWASQRVDYVINNLRDVAFEFCVDVVPAVTWEDHYGIPEVATIPEQGHRYRTGRWRLTSPMELILKTREANRRPRIAGVGAYVRTVKAIKQLKSAHLDGQKPSSLYYEFILHEGFERGSITGTSWADITVSALTYIARRLASADADPVRDPVLDEPYEPAPSAAGLATARAAFDELEQRARRAAASDSRCQAALDWRAVFGANQKYDHVFPLPPGCRGTGTAMGVAAAANLATGGTREKSFGEC